MHTARFNITVSLLEQNQNSSASLWTLQGHAMLLGFLILVNLIKV